MHFRGYLLCIEVLISNHSNLKRKKMKKLLFVLALGVFASCAGENKEAAADTTATTVDTAAATVDTTAATVDTTAATVDTTAKK